MKLLVFGRTGQVATELSRRAPPDVEVSNLGRAEADLTDLGAVSDAVQQTDADAVINAAAYTAVDNAETDELLALTVNGRAPAAMAAAAAARGLPILHLSTDYVFNGSGDRPWHPGDRTAPLSAYGRSKLAGETAIRAGEGPHVILRTSWVFSAHGTNFVKSMLHLSGTRDSLTVVADQTGGPTPAAALADALFAIARALTDDPTKSGTYQLAGAPDTSWAGFAREIFRLSGRATTVADIPTTAYPMPARRPLNSRLNCDSLATAFGIPRPDWRAGLAEVLTELGARS